MPSARFTVASMLPIPFAVEAKAPARMNITTMSMMLAEPAPMQKFSTRLFMLPLPTNITA